MQNTHQDGWSDDIEGRVEGKEKGKRMATRKRSGLFVRIEEGAWRLEVWILVEFIRQAINDRHVKKERGELAKSNDAGKEDEALMNVERQLSSQRCKNKAGKALDWLNDLKISRIIQNI